MKSFYNLKIGTKLLSSFIIIAIVAGLLGGFGMLNIKKLDNADTELYEKITVPLSEINDIAVSFQLVRINLRDIVEANEQSEILKYEQTIYNLRKTIDEKSILFGRSTSRRRR